MTEVSVVWAVLLTQDGWTACMVASHEGHAKVVDLLVDAGANKDAQNKVRENNSSCLKVVDELIFLRTVSISFVAKTEATALYIASQNGHAAVVQVLVDAGADKDARNKVSDNYR
jgi:ankyrin repeat protein